MRRAWWCLTGYLELWAERVLDPKLKLPARWDHR